MREPEGFREFVTARSPALVRTASMLTGDRASGQDLVQTALIRTWSRWDQVQRQDAPEAYVRKVMLTTYLSWRRRRWHAERPTDLLPDRAHPGDAYADVDLRAGVRGALATLPPRQRATLVLRFVEDLSEAQTADVLGCSVGSVKSQTSRGLAALRTSDLLSALLGEETPHGR